MIAGAVLCGGASRRMGADKALTTVGGVPMAERVAAALVAGGCPQVAFVGGDAVRLGALGRPLVADDQPGAGPAGGIITALDRLDADLVVVAACDLPLLDGGTVAALVDAITADESLGAVVALTDGWQQSLTCWRRTSLALLRPAWREGARSVHDLLVAVAHAEVPVDAARLSNANTPDEREHAERRARYLDAVPVQEIDVDQLADRVAAGARVVDVREPDEYVDGHVPGAILVPLATVPENVDAFTGAGPTYVICKSGGRSMRACEFLTAQGIAGLDVVNVAGGTMAWIASGRDVVGGDQPS